MKRAAYILLLIGGLCAGLHAEDSIRVVELEEVAITSFRHSPAVFSEQRLEGKELQLLSTQSVADALRYFSGVQVKDYGGVAGLKTMDLRSMGSHHLGVFYDGVEVGNAQNGIVDLGKFSMDNIESVSLFHGQKSELLQPASDYGSAGTLYLRTRRPKFRSGRNYSLHATMKAGSFALANPSILYEQRLTEAVHLSLNAEYTYASGRYHFRREERLPNGQVAWDTTGIRQNGDIQAFRAEAGIFGYLPQGKWHVKGYYYQSERGIPRAIVRGVWTSDQRQWDRNAFVQGSAEQHWDKISLLVNAKYSNDYMRYLNPDTTLAYLDNRFAQQECYLSAAMKYAPFKWWGLSLSSDYRYNTLLSNMEPFVAPRRHTSLTALATSFHYRWIKAQASALMTYVEDHLRHPTTEQPMAAKPSLRFTPAVVMSVQPMEKEQFFLRGFYKHIFRMPTFNDLYYTDMGNTDLLPEYSTQWDGGVEYDKTFTRGLKHCTAIGLHLQADGYFAQIHNKIVAIPKGNSQYRWMMMNLGYVEISGMDVSANLRWEMPHELSFSLGGTYTYQRAKDLSNPSDPLTYGGQIAYIPWHSASAIASAEWKGWSLHYSFIYVGERYHTSANIPRNYEEPWYTHDLKIGKLLQFEGWDLNTTVEVNNLLNQQYDVILNYPMPGINGKVIVQFIL